MAARTLRRLAALHAAVSARLQCQTRMATCVRVNHMDTTTAIDPILQSLRRALTELYGADLDRVVLFGSRARGDARRDSDYDVAVFLKHMDDRRAERNRLADLRIRFIEDTGAFIDAQPFRAASYRERTPLMHEIRRDGVIL
jgi:predicted nucleotidyltransferase